jgi:hypothetical protein
MTKPLPFLTVKGQKQRVKNSARRNKIPKYFVKCWSSDIIEPKTFNLMCFLLRSRLTSFAFI